MAGKGKRKKKKPNYKLRARNAALRMIAKEEGITFQEALKLYPRARTEYVWARAGRKLRKKFLEVSPGKFLQIEAGKAPKTENTYGKVHTVGDLKRIRALESYWSTVRLLAEAWGITLKEARTYYKKQQAALGKEAGRESVLQDLGIFNEYDAVVDKDEDEEEEE